jgi:hypothetical protein
MPWRLNRPYSTRSARLMSSTSWSRSAPLRELGSITSKGELVIQSSASGISADSALADSDIAHSALCESCPGTAGCVSVAASLAGMVTLGAAVEWPEPGGAECMESLSSAESSTIQCPSISADCRESVLSESAIWRSAVGARCAVVGLGGASLVDLVRAMVR